MKGQPEELRDFYKTENFQPARDNFYRAARTGLQSVFNWFGETITAPRLLLEKLIPMADSGLQKVNVSDEDRQRYLGVIENRALKACNGAIWQVRNYRELKTRFSKSGATVELTKGMWERQQSGLPVHEWPDIDCTTLHAVTDATPSIGGIMQQDLLTIQEDEALCLAEAIMDWKKIRHLPVENKDGDLVGLVTSTNIEQCRCRGNGWKDLSIKEVMVKNLITVPVETPLKTAIRLMEDKGIGSLPVVRGRKLLGLVTDTDLK